MTITIRSLILITIISIIRYGISTNDELIKQPEDIEIITENSTIPNDTSKYDLIVKDIKIYKYILNSDTKCTEVKQINKIENPLDPRSTVTQHLTIWKYDRSKHEGRYPLSFSYTKDDELVVDYGEECDIYVMFAGKWHFYGTGNIKTGKIKTDKFNSEIANKITIIITSVLVGILVIINFIMLTIISRLYKTINQVKLSVDRKVNPKGQDLY
ncbi:hypothetical protein MACK_002371 [Theileria orientalis]|uniref:Uncharacterized protein n=1 Tax=Theileria orientalis TaxID=68886 RepID=A0A976QUY9_THEOR|nr:hypothetical protein MACK_002371 [Theileria orientalis]